MGCGSGNRTEAQLPTERPAHAERKSGHSAKPKAGPESKPLSSKKSEERLPEKVEKKEVKEVGEIAIEPSQFVLEKSESIYHNYSLREKLGEGICFVLKTYIGSFGIVYKAVHKVSQDKRAIKFIDRSSVSAAEEAKLLQEISILRQLVHQVFAYPP